MNQGGESALLPDALQAALQIRLPPFNSIQFNSPLSVLSRSSLRAYTRRDGPALFSVDSRTALSTGCAENPFRRSPQIRRTEVWDPEVVPEINPNTSCP